MNLVLSQKHTRILYAVIMLFCFFPFVTPVMALAIGLVVAILGFRDISITKYTSFSLQASIVLMGFGMNLHQVLGASKTGFMHTAISVVVVMCVGLLIAKLLKVDGKIATLISAGTAICGGSAIAAVASVINPKSAQISV
ncbi:MAG: putative sulfate exporter family transporter, partial [Paludibacteraceae bacterium]|nr:putative sulfate exporter family transporter [Paludibacteraceae bacterium]